MGCIQFRHGWPKHMAPSAASAHLALSCQCTHCSDPRHQLPQRQKLRTTWQAISGKQYWPPKLVCALAQVCLQNCVSLGTICSCTLHVIMLVLCQCSRCTGYRPILDAFKVFAKADLAAYTEESIAASKGLLNGAATNGHDTNGNATIEHAANGHAANGHSENGHADKNGGISNGTVKELTKSGKSNGGKVHFNYSRGVAPDAVQLAKTRFNHYYY